MIAEFSPSPIQQRTTPREIAALFVCIGLQSRSITRASLSSIVSHSDAIWNHRRRSVAWKFARVRMALHQPLLCGHEDKGRDRPRLAPPLHRPQTRRVRAVHPARELLELCRNVRRALRRARRRPRQANAFSHGGEHHHPLLRHGQRDGRHHHGSALGRCAQGRPLSWQVRRTQEDQDRRLRAAHRGDSRRRHQQRIHAR